MVTHRRLAVLAVTLAAALALVPRADLAVAGVSPKPSSTNSQHGRELLLFTRQICSDDAQPCWEFVVSDAKEDHARVIAGPYLRSVWDDHFIANWAPDGRSVIFMADLGSGQAIWRVRTDGTDLHKVFSPTDGTGLDDGPAFTPDGRHIIFTRCCPVVSGYALWSITPDGHNLRQVTNEVVPSGVDGPSDNLPQVSPDGVDVAYHRNVVDSSTDPLGNRISVAPLSTGDFLDLTDPAFNGQIPNWSPDGGRLVYQSGDGNVWRVNRNGLGDTQLTFDGLSLNPSYTPDGQIIFARVTDDGGRDLYVMSAGGHKPRLIKATPGLERFPHLINLK